MTADDSRRPFLAVALTALAFVGIGLSALDLQERQARDVKRKLDLEDLETALQRSLAVTGTLPPTDQPTWCGVITAPEHRTVRDAVEGFVRETGKYAKPEKPFPTDPRFSGTRRDYAYWKTGPVSFELLAELEADDNNSRPLDLTHCELRRSEAGPARRSLGEGGPARRSLGEAGPARRSLGEGGYDYAISSLARNPL